MLPITATEKHSMRRECNHHVTAVWTRKDHDAPAQQFLALRFERCEVIRKSRFDTCNSNSQDFRGRANGDFYGAIADAFVCRKG